MSNYYSDPTDGSRQDYQVASDEAAKAALNLMVTRHLDDIIQTARGIKCTETQTQIGGVIDWTSTPSTDPEKPYSIRLQALRVGSTAFMGIGGELYTTLGWAVQETSPFANTVVINHNCSLICECGYILDDETLARVKDSAAFRGGVPGGNGRNLPGTVKPALEQYTREMFGKLL